AASQAFGHGSNDAQKTMGIITLALIIAGRQESLQVPLWVKTASAVTIALGTSAGGWRIIRTVATGITKLAPASGFAADLSSALTIFSATVLHLPVSTTHVISSAITGVGAAGGRHTVKWPTVARMLAAWMLTLPLTTVLGSFCYLLLR
ncbi:MAG: inorganic phosphate transporter, partial [Moorella sp. (in: Bacteria)]|nr:inorganic phosphate transporter [Moorella sp. (in: firmicutes)]